jgi:dihydrofolate reductase
MAKLTYTAIASLDGYTADVDGRFDFAMPDEALHAHVNALSRGIGTAIYGRRMYEVLAVWETMPTGPDEPEVINEYAELWRGMDKVVVSTTLTEASTARTRIASRFDADEVRRIVADADRNVDIGGPTLAAEAFRAGLVDEVHLYLHPVLVGGGLRALPDGVRLDLELVSEHRFDSGAVYLHHRVR